MRDIFKPRHNPARSIYDAFQAEASLRDGRSFEIWREAETKAVWCAARDWAQMHGRKVPTLEEVEDAERCAMGHVDYAAKWAYGVARLLERADESS